MKKLLGLVLVSSLLALITGAAIASEDGTKFSGKFYFDYFVDLEDREDADQTPERGFQLRRVYATVKKSWGDVMFRSTTDIDYKFGTGNLGVFQKYAYLSHSGLIDNANVVIGLHSPNTHGWVDGKWGYRSMAKTFSDANKWTSAAGFGAGIFGKAADGAFAYSLDLNNGNGYKEPVRKDGIGLAARGVFESGPLVLSGAFTSDTEGTYANPDDSETNLGSDEADTYVEGVIGFEQDRYSLFGQYGLFTEGDHDTKSNGISVFGKALITDGTYIVGRFDMIDPDTDVDDDGHNYMLFGIDHELHKGIYLQPSVRIMSFQASGMDSHTEIVLTVLGKI